MKTRKTKWLTRLCLLACVLAAGWWIYSRLHSEPTYEGKTVSDWYKDYCRSSWPMNYDAYKHDEATSALRQMGSNAVPYLIKEAFSKGHTSSADSNFTSVVNSFRKWRGWPLLVNTEIMRDEAPLVLIEIKPAAAQILPLTTNYLKSRDAIERRQALLILGTVGNGAQRAVPHLVAGLKDADPYAPVMAVQSLEWIGPPASNAMPSLIEILKGPPGTNYIKYSVANALAKIGPSAKAAVPVLIRELSGTNGALSGVIPLALTNIGVATDMFLPAMKGQLTSSNETTRLNAAMHVLQINGADHDALTVLTNMIDRGSGIRALAIETLGNAGPPAAEALPVLRRIVKDSADQETKEKAIRAIKKIEGPPK